jgi:hypothetical protein
MTPRRGEIQAGSFVPGSLQTGEWGYQDMIRVLANIFKCVAYLMTIVMLFLIGIGISSFLEGNYYTYLHAAALPLTYLTVLFMPYVFSIIQSSAHGNIEELPKKAFRASSGIIGLAGIIVLAYFDATTPRIDVFYQKTGRLLTIILIVTLATNVLRYVRAKDK